MPSIRIAIPRQPLLVAGLMSGTSADGIDVAIVRISGPETRPSCQLLHFTSLPYQPALRTLLLEQAEISSSDVCTLSQLNFRLAHAFKDALETALKEAGYKMNELDLIGSHGHTVHHVPDPVMVAGMELTSTLQIGDPSVLATLTGVPVVGDFRVADMALGGQGAPVVPFLEYVALMDPHETRVSLNLGGIANLSILPSNGKATDVIAFDIGPGNMVIDALCLRYFDQPFDESGKIAREGTVIEPLILDILKEDYFNSPPPKSTGREAFGKEFVQRFIERAGAYQVAVSPADLVATATALTALSIRHAFEHFVALDHKVARVIVSGGGVHNPTLMGMIQEHMGPIPVEPASAFDLDPDAKEAICFGMMAYATLHGVPANLPSVTGASMSAILGKICLPTP